MLISAVKLLGFVCSSSSPIAVWAGVYQNTLGGSCNHLIALRVLDSSIRLLYFLKCPYFCELAVPRPFACLDRMSPSDLRETRICAAHGHSDLKEGIFQSLLQHREIATETVFYCFAKTVFML